LLSRIEIHLQTIHLLWRESVAALLDLNSPVPQWLLRTAAAINFLERGGCLGQQTASLTAIAGKRSLSLMTKTVDAGTMSLQGMRRYISATKL
jgi:hypothetical protein